MSIFDEDYQKYLIKEGGFIYDTRRGVFCTGSSVAKSCHPLAAVEAMKSELISDGTLIDGGDHYNCTCDTKTGPLMAYNLHCKRLKLELPDCDVAFEEGSGEMIPANEALRLWLMGAAGSEQRERMEKDSYRVIKFIEVEYDRTFVNGKGDGSLSKVEQFVIDALLAAGEIDEYRRGDPADRECDIVDEKRKRQIEFVSLFDEKVPPRVRYRNELNEEQALLMEYSDFGYNIVATGVINKFTLKDYTDRYSKELAIYMLGPNGEAADKIEAMIDMLSARIDQIRNNYTKIHVILHDPLENESFVYCSNDRLESFPDSLCTYNIVERHPADPDHIDPDKNYLIIKQSIFDPEIKSMYWIKGELILSDPDIVH